MARPNKPRVLRFELPRLWWLRAIVVTVTIGLGFGALGAEVWQFVRRDGTLFAGLAFVGFGVAIGALLLQFGLLRTRVDLDRSSQTVLERRGIGWFWWSSRSHDLGGYHDVVVRHQRHGSRPSRYDYSEVLVDGLHWEVLLAQHRDASAARRIAEQVAGYLDCEWVETTTQRPHILDPETRRSLRGLLEDLRD